MLRTKRFLGAAVLAAAFLAGELADGAEIAGVIAGATAEERVQDDALFGGGRDLVTVVSPEIGYAMAGPRLVLSLRYDANVYDYFGDLQQVDVDHLGFLHLEALLSRRVTLTTDGTLQRVTDPLELDRLGVPRVAGPVLFSAAALEVDDRLADRWTLGAGYQMQLAHFETPALIDGSTHAPWVEMARKLGPLDELALRLRGQLFLRVSTPDAYTETPILVWRHRFAPAWRFELSGGPIAYQAVGETPAWTPYAYGALIWTLHHGEVELRAGRDVVGATGAGGALWADYAEAGWVGRLGRHWAARIGGTYFLNGLAPDQAVAISGYGAEAALDWTPARDWKVEAAVDRIDQTATLAQFSTLDLGLDVAALRVSWKWGSDGRLR